MPEANVLYVVSAAVVAGLVIWVAAVLKMAKEPWARPTPELARTRAADAPLMVPEADANAEADAKAKADAKEAGEAANVDPDATAKVDAETIAKVDADATVKVGAKTD